MKNDKAITQDNYFSLFFLNKLGRKYGYFLFLVCSIIYIQGMGCKNFPKFDSTGKCLFEKSESQSCLFSSKTQTAETIADSKEKEIIRATQNQTNESPWAPTDSNVNNSNSTTANGATNAVYWNSQRPNGGVLFPTSLAKQGPLLVLEPKTTIAQVGEEIVLVGSYVGEDNEYLRVNEKIEWGLDGEGRFLTSNPNNLINSCSLSNDKDDERSRTTLTSTKLWRIHRGTETRSDDISILKGQTWMTLLSNQEGISNISIFTPNIDDWNNRTASATVHWIDASFSFPSSRISPLGQPQYLTTTVLRKSDLTQGRQNWIVRYEILSGPAAGFGPDMAKVCEVLTDDKGQATVALNQQEQQVGTNRISIQIFEPATAETARFLVDQKTISFSWTGSAFFNIQTEGTTQVKLGSNAAYSIHITNVTSVHQNATVRMPIPAGTQFVASSSQPPALVENNNAIWILNNVPPKAVQKIQFELEINTTDPFFITPRVSQTENISSTSTIIPTEISNTTINPETLPPNPATPGNVQPPNTQQNGQSPTNNPPSTNNQSTDPASKVPLLDEKKTDNISLPAGEKLAFQFVNPFPKQAKKDEQFPIAFKIANPHQLQLPNIMIRIQIPQGVIYHFSDSVKYDQQMIDTAPIPLSQLIERPTPMIFSSSQTGPQTIILQILDPDKKVLASSTNVTNIIDNPTAPQPEQTSTPSTSQAEQTPVTPNVSMQMSNESAKAPNFETGQTVPFHFIIKNNDSTPLTNVNFILVQEKTRSNLPWKLENSTPAGAQTTSLTGESWQLSINSIPANGQQEIVMFLTPIKDIASGIMSAGLYANNLSNPIAQQDYVYSISTVRNSQRPSTEKALDQNEKSNQEQLSQTEPNVTESSSGKDAENSTPAKDNQNLEEKRPVEPQDQKISKTTETELKTELNVDSIMIKPKITNGQPDAILIHQNSEEKSSSKEAQKDQPFAYRMELVNQEKFPIEPKRLTIAMTVSEHLTFSSDQPQNSLLEKTQSEKNKWTYVLQESLESQKPYEIALELVPVQSGMATLDIEIFDEKQLIAVIQHPISISE